MADRDTKRYYWLKLDKDFFKRHDIRVVESMPNGKDYILFYLKLLCESTSHEGYLRFNEAIPYDDNMLATITNTNIDVVRSAIKIFSSLNMMSFMDDGTLYLEQVNKMIGSETGAAIRKREYRENQKYLTNKSDSGTLSQSCPLEKDIDIEIDKEKEKEINKERPTTLISYLSFDPKDTIPFEMIIKELGKHNLSEDEKIKFLKTLTEEDVKEGAINTYLHLMNRYKEYAANHI